MAEASYYASKWNYQKKLVNEVKLTRLPINPFIRFDLLLGGERGFYEGDEKF